MQTFLSQNQPRLRVFNASGTSGTPNTCLANSKHNLRVPLVPAAKLKFSGRQSLSAFPLQTPVQNPGEEPLQPELQQAMCAVPRRALSKLTPQTPSQGPGEAAATHKLLKRSRVNSGATGMDGFSKGLGVGVLTRLLHSGQKIPAGPYSIDNTIIHAVYRTPVSLLWAWCLDI